MRFNKQSQLVLTSPQAQFEFFPYQENTYDAIELFGWMPEDEFFDYEDAPLAIRFSEEDFYQWCVQKEHINITYREEVSDGEVTWVVTDDYNYVRDEVMSLENILSFVKDRYVTHLTIGAQDNPSIRSQRD